MLSVTITYVKTSNYDNAYSPLPGQEFSLHEDDSDAGPNESHSPRKHGLFLVRLPPPQVWEQSDQSPQLPNTVKYQ